MSHRYGRSCGFTITELAVVAAILIVVSAASFPSIVSSYEEQRLRQAAIELQSHLLRARTLAQRLQKPCRLTIAASGSETTVTAAGGDSSTTLCSRSEITDLRLSSASGVRGLVVGQEITAAGSTTTSVCGTPACSLEFNTLAALNGPPQLFTVRTSNNRTAAQYCVQVGLTLNRVGSRNGSSGTCNFTRG